MPILDQSRSAVTTSDVAESAALFRSMSEKASGSTVRYVADCCRLKENLESLQNLVKDFNPSQSDISPADFSRWLTGQLNEIQRTGFAVNTVDDQRAIGGALSSLAHAISNNQVLASIQSQQPTMVQSIAAVLGVVVTASPVPSAPQFSIAIGNNPSQVIPSPAAPGTAQMPAVGQQVLLHKTYLRYRLRKLRRKPYRATLTALAQSNLLCNPPRQR